MALLQYQSLAFVPIVVAAVASPVFVQGQNPDPVHVQSFQYQSSAGPLVVPPPAETLTVDKWTVLTEQPKFRQKLLVNPEGAYVVLPQPEPVTPAVYVNGQTPGQIYVQSFQYPSEARPVRIDTVPELASLDKWKSAWPDPYFRRKRLVQYGVNTAIGGQADDGLPPVWWLPETNTPTRKPVPRTQLFSVTVSITLPIAQPPSAVYVQGSQPGPIWLESFQYPGVTAERLHMAPDVPVAVVYVQGVQPGPAWVQSFQYESIAGERLHIVPSAVPLDRWQQDFVLVPHRKRLADYSQSQIDPTLRNEQTSLDKWVPHRPDLPNRVRPLIDYSLFAIDPTPRAERPGLDKWGQPVSRPVVAVQRRVYPSFVAGLAPSETVTIDKWLTRWTARPRATVARQYVLLVSSFYHLVVTEVVTPDKWIRSYPDLISRARRLREYPQSVIDLTPRSERASVDKWGQPTQQPRFDKKRNQWLYPSLAIDSEFYRVPPSEIIRLDKWNRQYPDLIFRLKRLPDYSQFSIDPTLRSESVSIDRWGQPQVRPYFIKRTVQLENIFTFVSETVTLDKWLMGQTQISRKARRVIPPPDQVLFVPEPITLDKWLFTRVDRFSKAQRVPLSTDQLIVVPESITLDKWFTEARIVRPDLRVVYSTTDLLSLIIVPYIPEALAEPVRTRPCALIPATPELYAELPFVDWYQLVDIPLPQFVVSMRHYEGVNVVLVIPGDVVLPTPRTSGSHRPASISTKSTDAGVSPYRRDATIKRSR